MDRLGMGLVKNKIPAHRTLLSCIIVFKDNAFKKRFESIKINQITVTMDRLGSGG